MDGSGRGRGAAIQTNVEETGTIAQVLETAERGTFTLPAPALPDIGTTAEGAKESFFRRVMDNRNGATEKAWPE
jgi:hypothetical protein